MHYWRYAAEAQAGEQCMSDIHPDELFIYACAGFAFGMVLVAILWIYL